MTIREQELDAMRTAHDVLCDILRYAKFPRAGETKVRDAAEKLYAAMNGMPLKDSVASRGSASQPTA